MSVIFTPAPEVGEIASELIPQYHAHLKGLRIDYAFRSDWWKSKGKLVYGKAMLITGHNAYLATRHDQRPPDKFFFVAICGVYWLGMSESERRALVDHELCHCWAEHGELSILPHDVEEFRSVIERHGLWSPDVRSFGEIAARKQTQLSLMDDAATMPVNVNRFLNIGDDVRVEE